MNLSVHLTVKNEDTYDWHMTEILFFFQDFKKSFKHFE